MKYVDKLSVVDVMCSVVVIGHCQPLWMHVKVDIQRTVDLPGSWKGSNSWSLEKCFICLPKSLHVF